jgi:hypothetical protein
VVIPRTVDVRNGLSWMSRATLGFGTAGEYQSYRSPQWTSDWIDCRSSVGVFQCLDRVDVEGKGRVSSHPSKLSFSTFSLIPFYPRLS